jgi:hypothetical protein
LDIQFSADAEQDGTMEDNAHAALVDELTQTADELVAEAGRLQDAADELMAEAERLRACSPGIPEHQRSRDLRVRTLPAPR